MTHSPEGSPVRCISWNVNGLRAIMKKDFQGIFATFDADIFALQETKCQAGQVDFAPEGWRAYWSFAAKAGYAGTAVFTKREPLRVLHGCGLPALDTEGRICALEFPEFWFVCVYTPNAQRELTRLTIRMEWDDAFRDFCCGLEQGVLPAGVGCEAASEGWEPRVTQPGEAATPKPVVMCGDFNVAHQEIDLKNFASNRGNAGFTDEERGKFTELLGAGFADTFRRLHPDVTGAYSWWSYMFNARANNAGWRIDYFLVSEALMGQVASASIYPEVFGSDHCPVGIELER